MDKNFYNDFYNLLKEFFIELQTLVNKSSSENKFIFSHHEFPKFDDPFPNGMPSISTFYIDGPKDYSSLFKPHDEEHFYNYTKTPSFQKLALFLSSHVETFKKHIFFQSFKNDIDFIEHGYGFIEYNIFRVFDSYMHQIHSNSFDEKIFKETIRPFFNKIFSETLKLNVAVPILMIHFDKEIIPINENVQIRKMTEKELLSSYKVGPYSDTYEVFAVSCATHILELMNYSLPNVPMFSWFALDHKEAYPLEEINKWFVAFRIITKLETGYGQVLSYPVGWGCRAGNLMEVHGDKILNFNYKIITNSMWNKPLPTVNSEQLKSVSLLYNFLIKTSNNSMNIAVRRLNLSYLRESDEDAIIDLVIAIEALVCNNDHGEITHKVSTRTALILSTLPDCQYTTIEVYSIVKKLYDFRSKVVHGSAKIDNSKLIKIKANITKDPISVATELLQNLILAISKKPEFLETAKIDSFFLEKYDELFKHEIKSE